MSDASDYVRNRIAKRDSANFTLEDITEYLSKQAKPEAKVHVLKLGEWVTVNNHELFLKIVTGDMEDAWIKVLIKKHNRWLNWLTRPLARIFTSEELVFWWNVIPNTNLLLDVWYVGDGSEGVPLVFEVNQP